MFKKITGLCFMIALTSIAHAATDTTTQDIKVDQSSISSDQKILNSAHTIIENQFRKYNVTTTVHDGNITLKGYVEDEPTIKAIEVELKKIKGVKSVNNMLKVKPAIQK